MACFLVSGAEAIAVSAVQKHEEKKEAEAKENGTFDEYAQRTRIPLSQKLKWLSSMLWGGVILLAFEHLWHGEIAPFFPFLTAMGDPADTAEMLQEMATVGVGMAALITIVWFGICAAADIIVSRDTTKGVVR